MLLLFIFLLVISAAVASIAWFATRRKSLPPIQADSFDLPPQPRSLFAPDEADLRDWQREQDDRERAEQEVALRLNLLKRADEGDFNSLLEAKIYGKARLYDEVFQILFISDANKLADFVAKNGLSADVRLVELSAKKLLETPNLDNLLKSVHLAALTNSPEIFSQVLETTDGLWKEKRLIEISAGKLIEIFESHYWLLASDARVSGAGYLLKEKMASMRHEILGK